MTQLIDPFHDEVIGQEAKDQVSANIILVTAVLDTFVETTLEHVRKTGGQCVRACVGREIGYVTTEMARENPKALVATLQLAIRRLAELEYEKEILS